MIQIFEVIQDIFIISPIKASLFVGLILYGIYYSINANVHLVIKGKCNTKTKNIGKTLPFFPNGWYVVMHSNQLQNGQSKSVDIAGQNLVVFRSTKGQAFILEAYCKHLGANLGVEGKVVNEKCVQCPFHGWLYDGTTGLCVDYDGKPIQGKSIQYNQQFTKVGGKLQWKQQKAENIRLKKYPICEVNGFIYVWIHALQQYATKPQYPMLNFQKYTKHMEYRGKTIHHVTSHIQDIPENGADIAHFKFIHTKILTIPESLVHFKWNSVWKAGDDPKIQEVFSHKIDYVHQLKQQIFKEIIEKFPQRRFIGAASIDNYIKLPFLDYKLMLNITAIQLGPSTVFIFLRFPTHLIILNHYLEPKQKFYQKVHHEAMSSWWLPYWLTHVTLRGDYYQVTSDMNVWQAKQFVKKLYLRQEQQSDRLIRNWRTWYSQNYEGTQEKQQKRAKDSSW